MRIPIYSYGLLCAALLFISIGHKLTSAEKPNVVLIYIDDLGYGDIGCYDCEDIPTPGSHVTYGFDERTTSRNIKYMTKMVGGPCRKKKRESAF